VQINPASVAALPGGAVPIVTETRIGADNTTGQWFPAANDPHNLSRSYSWRTDVVDDVPFTERSQFIGDPRHCPYADLKDIPTGGTAAANPLANGYNWFFDNFQKTSTVAANNFLGAGKWEGWSAARIHNGAAAGNHNFDGWRATTAVTGDCYEIDVARLFQILRRGLVECGAIWTTLTGFSYYYLGIGGEIGYDSANGFPSSIPVNTRPFTGVAAGSRFEDSITTAMTGGVKYIREVTAGNYWWGAHWIGELFPDTAYAQWMAKGNLDTPTAAGNAAGKFVRIRRQDIPNTNKMPAGTDWTPISWVRRTNVRGCTSFFGIGTPTTSATPTAIFRHNFNGGQDGALAAGPGTELGEDFNFALPTTTKISRPFQTNFAQAWGFPDEFAFYDIAACLTNYQRYSAGVPNTPPAGILRRFYGHVAGAAYQGSSIVHLYNPAGTRRAAIVVSGLDMTTESGSAFIAKMATLSLIYTFLDSGLYPVAPVTELPRVTVDSPTNVTELTNPATILMAWSTSPRRWDNNTYTRNWAAAAYTGTQEADFRYARLYSDDNGATWKDMSDDAVVNPGSVPMGRTWPDAGLGQESFVWDVSDTAKFPEGSYLIRVECYRLSNPTNHYSFHQQKIFIDR